MYKYMVIDDDRLIREHIRELLADHDGLEFCGEAEEGEEAMEVFRQTKPHIVITDINIPLRNGLDVARQMKRENKELEIVVITGYGTLEYAREAIDTCAAGFIVKPVNKEELDKARNHRGA